MADDAYREWAEASSHEPLAHFLNQIEESKAFCSHHNGSHHRESVHNDRRPQVKTARGATGAVLDRQPRRRKLFVCVNVTEIRAIDPSSESFACRVRLYMIWSPFPALDSHCKGGHDKDGQTEQSGGQQQTFEALLGEFEEKARRRVATGEDDFYPLTTEETVLLARSGVHWPTVRFFNAISSQVLDEAPGVRVYNPSSEHGSTILWNCQYLLELRSHFRLQAFPFDQQELLLEIRMDDPRTWDLFDLTVCCVQFHRHALELAEWGICLPAVRRGSPAHKTTDVVLRVKRHSTFFVMNVICILSMLSVLTFVVFALPLDGGLADRINVILTLFLTSVAFKFVIGESIPKVGYTTLLDVFVLANMLFLFLSCFVCVAGTWLIQNGVPAVAGVELNTALLCLSVFLLVVLDGWWLAKVLRSRTLAAPRLNASPGRTWYAFAYANPFFMRPAQKSKGD
jgi:hypothetical protein